MRRYYRKGRLVNSDPSRFLLPNSTAIWRMPPYVVAEFCGELAGVMMNAAKDYIYQKTSRELKKKFRDAAFNKKNNSN